MTDEKILKKAIHKACLNGFTFVVPDRLEWDILTKEEKNLKYIEWYINKYRMEEIIFSHSFAKAFWKNTNHLGEVGKGHDFDRGWMFHLKEMVLEENPIKYLEKFL